MVEQKRRLGGIMAKRFTDTDKYRKPFIRGLLAPYKLLWDYLYHDCNHAGIWIVDFEIAQIYLGKDAVINKEEALKYFNKNAVKIVELDNGDKWFIPSFIDFQYGELKENNRAHKSVIDILIKYKVLSKTFKPLIRPLQGRKSKDMDKDIDKDKKEEYILLFDKARELYPGTKKGNQTEFENFVKKHSDWDDIISLIFIAINNQKTWKEEMKKAEMFVPEWKHFQTWINQRCWEEEKPVIIDKKQSIKKKTVYDDGRPAAF